jgi:hypothetical protein
MCLPHNTFKVWWPFSINLSNLSARPPYFYKYFDPRVCGYITTHTTLVKKMCSMRDLYGDHTYWVKWQYHCQTCIKNRMVHVIELDNYSIIHIATSILTQKSVVITTHTILLTKTCSMIVLRPPHISISDIRSSGNIIAWLTQKVEWLKQKHSQDRKTSTIHIAASIEDPKRVSVVITSTHTTLITTTWCVLWVF